MNRIFWEMPKAVVTVILLWSLLLSLIWFPGWLDIAERYKLGVLGMLLAWLVGVVLWKAYAFGFVKERTAERLKELWQDNRIEDARYEILSTSIPDDIKRGNFEIYQAPVPVTFNPLPKEIAPKWLLRRWPGFDEYKKRHPKHADVFLSILEVLSHYDSLPATHYKDGHGGYSLAEHSMNVVVLMSRIGHKFRYYGVYDKEGKLIHGLESESTIRRGYYQFNQNDPLLPLVALGHDLGKILAFIYDPPSRGRWSSLMKQLRNLLGVKHKPELIEVVPGRLDHDVLSKRALMLIPELFSLPVSDRQDFLAAVGYHHHHAFWGETDGHMMTPLPWSEVITDRQHALAALIDYVDEQTARLESGERIRPFFVPEKYRQKTSEGQTAEEPKEDKKRVRKKNAQHQQPENQKDNGSNKGVREAASTTEKEDVVEHGQDDSVRNEHEEEVNNRQSDQQAFQWFEEMLREFSGRRKVHSGLNAQDEWIFVDDRFWRDWLYKTNKPVSSPETLAVTAEGWVHPITMSLLDALKEKGAVPTDDEVPLYCVSVEKKDGSKLIRDPVIVVNQRAFSLPIKIGQSRLRLMIEGVSGQADIADDVSAQSNAGSCNKSPEKAGETDGGIPKKICVDAFIEWVGQVQRMEHQEIAPFKEKRKGGQVYALVDPLAIPERYMGCLPEIGADPRITLIEDSGMIQVPVSL